MKSKTYIKTFEDYVTVNNSHQFTTYLDEQKFKLGDYVLFEDRKPRTNYNTKGKIYQIFKFDTADDLKYKIRNILDNDDEGWTYEDELTLVSKEEAEIYLMAKKYNII